MFKSSSSSKSPLLYTLYTHDWVPTHPSNEVMKFADDATVVGLITSSFLKRYRAMKARTNRLRNSFHPKAIMVLDTE